MYDAFISYRWVSPDQEWVRDALFPALQAAGLRVLLDVEDFVPGRDLMLEMTRAGQSSRRLLCVITPAYFDGNRMVGFEALTARRTDPSGTDSKLVPLLLRATQLPEWMRGLVPVDWTNPTTHAREWRKLLRVLGASNDDSPPPRSFSELTTAPDSRDPVAVSTPTAPIRTSPPAPPSRDLLDDLGSRLAVGYGSVKKLSLSVQRDAALIDVIDTGLVAGRPDLVAGYIADLSLSIHRDEQYKKVLDALIQMGQLDRAQALVDKLSLSIYRDEYHGKIVEAARRR
jgi:hypothetical protein